MSDYKKTYTEYTFSLREDDNIELEGFPLGKFSEHRVTFDSGTCWHSVMYEFAKFLSMHYGYDIVDKLEVDGVKLGDSIYTPNQAKALKKAINDMLEDEQEDLWVDWEPAMKKKNKKKKKAKNFIMGSAEDWAGEE